MSSTRYWIETGKQRIGNILKTHRITTRSHLEIKISEAGPFNQRPEPVQLTTAINELKEEKFIRTIDPVEEENLPKQPNVPENFFLVGSDYGKRGDRQKLKKMQNLYSDFQTMAQRQDLCGLYLEKLLYEAIVQLKDIYHIVGAGPTLGDNGELKKESGSEVIFYGGKKVYGEAGFDLFLIHKETGIPIGIEAKNLRRWLYPETVEIWRAIARGCSLDCLPVIASRKFSYTSRARLFAPTGVMGFQTQFQYFNPKVKKQGYRIKDIVDKNGLGFADIKMDNEPPNHFIHYFKNILPPQIEPYYERFQENKEILEHYAIEEGMAESSLQRKKRNSLYHEFSDDLGI